MASRRAHRDKPLPRRWLRFAQEYAVDLKGGEAAVRAGYASKSADAKASELLAIPEVKAAVQRLIDQRAERTGVKLERVLAELARIAFIDPATFYDEDGNLLPIREMPEDTRRALNSIEIDSLKKSGKTSSWTTKVRYEKRAALHDLLEHLAPRRLELTGKAGHPLVPVTSRVDLSKVPTEVLVKALERLGA